MADVPLRPLEVFAIDENMNRASGTIPYKSLTWSRRYHECGQFSMVVPADVYDPSWAYIYADARPETGIVQKVEYSDTAHTPDGVDTVTVSGFFLECFLNRLTFLVEQPEEQTIEIQIPPPKTPGIMRKDMPTVWRDPDTGEYIYKSAEGDLITQNGVQVDGDSDWEEVKTTFRGLTKPDGGWGALPTDMISSNFNYKTADGKITVTSWFGKSETFDIVMEDDRGNVYYKTPGYPGEGGYAICIANACATRTANKAYAAQKRAWDASGGVRYETITVKGPWQRTDTMEPITEGDSVQQLFKWLQTFFGSTFKYEEPTFEGVVKTLDPSLQRMGDFAYSVLQEVGASLRVVYGFENDTLVLEAYRGLDRTMKDPEPASFAQPVTLLARVVDVPQPILPSGYAELEYIKSSGRQYIDTGYIPSQDTRVVIDMGLDSTGDMNVAGVRNQPTNNRDFDVYIFNGGWTSQYAGSLIKGTAPKAGRFTLDMNGNHVTTSDGTMDVTHTYTAFTAPGNFYLFTFNQSGAGTRRGSYTIYSCKIYEDGAQVRDLVPAKRGSDGAAGLYDRVGGVFYGNSGTGSLIAGPEVTHPAQLSYYPNAEGATGTVSPQSGEVGDTVQVAENGFTYAGHSFTGWSTAPTGGTTYHPGESFVLTGMNDSLYAQWQADQPTPTPTPSGDYPWAVFSDTWGTIYDYSASRDESNYRNICYVLYQYDEPSSFEADGTPTLVTDYEDDGETISGWHIPYTTKRGYQTASVKTSTDEPDMECYLDLRDSGGTPACDSEWSRDEYPYDENEPGNGKPTLSPMKEQYEQWLDALTALGEKELREKYGVVTNLDTGTVVTSGYMADWDMGDLVDFGVSTMGLTSQARVIGVDEVYESGKADIRITVGDELLTNAQKQQLN